MLTIDTTNMCSHLQRKLFDEDGIYHPLWLAMQDDLELTAVVRSRQLHIYRNGKRVLVLKSSERINSAKCCNYLLKFCLRKSLGDFPKARRQNLPKNERLGKPSSSAISFTERSVFSR